MQDSAQVSEIVRKLYASFAAKDRRTVEALLSDDFTFSSPRDDHIDKAAYFERCWPNSDKIRAFDIEQLFANDHEAFVRYAAERSADGTRFRNTEYLRVEGGKVREVDVYFGRDLPRRGG
ncbi:MAG TPA: nuclear transport factor 2 family protein [Burkholderiales bacterium]|jgi:ketosteroid isomerase-like protein